MSVTGALLVLVLLVLVELEVLVRAAYRSRVTATLSIELAASAADSISAPWDTIGLPLLGVVTMSGGTYPPSL